MANKNLRKFGFFILLYDICATIAFMCLYFGLGNTNPVINPPLIIEVISGLSIFCFIVGFLWLLVGNTALILNKKSGISVTLGGILLFIAATIGLSFSAFMVFIYAFPNSEFYDKLFSIVILLAWTCVIICPASFFFRKLKKLRV